MLKFVMSTNTLMMLFFKLLIAAHICLLVLANVYPATASNNQKKHPAGIPLTQATTANATAAKTTTAKTSCPSNVFVANPPKQRGIALGLYSEDPSWSYMDMLTEIKATGASHVSVVVPYYIKTNLDHVIYKHPRFSAPMHVIERTINQAKKLGLNIFLFPILRVEDKSNGGWRGSLAPKDINAFFKNYAAYIAIFADLAQRMDVALFSIGSELSTMDVKKHEHHWRKIITQVRSVYKGPLTYSANWDHYNEVPFFDALDYAGLTGYFELTDKEKAPREDPKINQLVKSWRHFYMQIIRWQHTVQKPIIFTEVGYLSQKGTSARPWNEGADEQLDLDIQRRCYESFIRVWNDEERLGGVYFWNWFGWGGDTSKEYSPRNKPAAEELKKWYTINKKP